MVDKQVEAQRVVDYEIKEDALYQLKQGYVLREIAGEYLAIPVSLEDGSDESKIAALNVGAQFLWNLLQQERTIVELVRMMTEEYDVSSEEAHADIIEFIGKLLANHLLIAKVETQHVERKGIEQ